jgi:hypothetical protein
VDTDDVKLTLDVGRQAEIIVGRWGVVTVPFIHAAPGHVYNQIGPQAIDDAIDRQPLEDVWLMRVDFSNPAGMVLSFLYAAYQLVAPPNPLILAYQGNTSLAVSAGLQVGLYTTASCNQAPPIRSDLVQLVLMRTTSTTAAGETIVGSILLWCGPRGTRPPGVA